MNWLLAEQYFKVDEPDTLIEEADDEVTEKLKRKALFQKHLDGASLVTDRPGGQQ